MATMSLEDCTLSDSERDSLVADLERDGFVTLPMRMPDSLLADCRAAVDRIAAAQRAADPDLGPVRVANCVDADPAFWRLALFKPALQLAWDVFGPMFQLNQSNFTARPRDTGAGTDFLNATPWHADGPRPANFPTVNGVMGLHYLKFGYFLNDIPSEGGSPLQVVRGSHLRPELDGKKGRFDIEDYAKDVVEIRCQAGTVIAFNQAQWHAAAPNTSDVERKNCYISYCPTWMRPFDRKPIPRDEAAGLSQVEQRIFGVELDDPKRWWLPREGDADVLAAYARQG